MIFVHALAEAFLSTAGRKVTAAASFGRRIWSQCRKGLDSRSTESTRESFTKTGTSAETSTGSSEEALWTSVTESLPMMIWDFRSMSGPLVKMRGPEVILDFPKIGTLKLKRNEEGAWEPNEPGKLNLEYASEMAKALDTLYDKYLANMVVT